MHEPELPPRDADIARCGKCGAWYHRSKGCFCDTEGCVECGKPTENDLRGYPRKYCSKSCLYRADNRRKRTPKTDFVEQPRNDRWMDAALCAQADPELWFCDSRTGVGDYQAIAICKECPVIEPCLAEGMNHEFGIWGGWDESSRTKLKRRLNRINPAARAAIIKSAAKQGRELLKHHLEEK